MASEDDQPIFNDDDFDDDDDDSEPFHHHHPDLPVDSPSSSSSSDNDTTPTPTATITTSTTSAVVTVAIPSASIPPPSSTSVTVALPDPKRFSSNPNPNPNPNPEKKPIDDSRRLFQRLWTDEDEIELLQGFLDYTSGRGVGTGHHHDTAAFYDQIKSKLQLEFNKNQLVEKLRRLKKKYRNVLSKMSSGKEFVFKSPHDQATFELSRKIWSNISANFRPGVNEFDDDDQNSNPNPNPNLNLNPSGNVNAIMVGTPPRPPNSSYVISHINLNNAATATATPMVVDHNNNKAGSYNSNMMNSASNVGVGFDVMMSNLNSPAAKLSSRKRPRVGVVKIEDKFVRNVGVEGGNLNDNSNNVTNSNTFMNNVSNNTNNSNNSNVVGGGGGGSNINLGSTMQGLIEEAVRSCLSPMVKELVNNAVNGAVFGGGGGSSSGSGGFKGVGALALNAVPLNFSGANVLGSGSGSGGDVMDEKWRKQQILELEVYSKRLELVQDQIKLSLEELRSMGS